MFRTILSRGMLRLPEGDPPGGGGGGGNNEPGKTDPDLPNMVNAAVSSQLKRNLGPAIAEALKGFDFKGLLTPLVTDLVPKPPAPSSDDPDDPPGDDPPKRKKAANPELEKRITELATDLEKMKSARDESERKRLEVEQARRVDAATIRLRAALQDKVAPGAIEHALSFLTVVQKRMKVDEDGNATFRVRKEPYKGLPKEEVDVSLEEAIPLLLEEDDMKLYLPAPKGGGGSNPGPRSPGGGGAFPTYTTPAQNDEEKARRAYEKEQALVARLPQLKQQ